MSTTSSASQIDNGRGAINSAINTLMAQRRVTTDAAQIASINDAIETLNGNLQDLNQAQGLAVANTLDAASNELQKIVASSPKDISTQFLGQIKDAIARLEATKDNPGT